MLRQCPRLISLKMLCFRSGQPDMGTIVLPALQFLEIQEFDSAGGLSNAPGILAVILAPALNTLVYNREDSIAQEPQNLLALLKRTPNLTHLTLGDCPADTLLECVQHCPPTYLPRSRQAVILGAHSQHTMGRPIPSPTFSGRRLPLPAPEPFRGIKYLHPIS